MINWSALDLRKAMIGYILVFSVFVATEYTYKRWVVDAEHWLKYYDVIPAKKDFTSGESLQFYSDREVYRKTFVDWIDIVYCDTQGSSIFGYITVYKSSDFIYPHSRKPLSQLAPWRYDKNVPVDKGRCVMKAIIVVNAGYGIKHRQLITTRTFTIGLDSAKGGDY